MMPVAMTQENPVEQGSLGDLYLRHAPEGIRLAFLMTGDRALAEDLVQEAFARLIGRLRHLRDPSAFADHTSWSPDGRWIAFTNSGNTAAIYVVHPDGTGLHQVEIEASAGLVNVFGPAWSPDGEYLAFQGWDGEPDPHIDLYVARADGTHVVQIKDTAPYEAGLDWTSAQT
jgi:Tol biopolymer transport system component